MRPTKLTWAGQHYYRGFDEGLAEARAEGCMDMQREAIADLAGPFQFELTPERQARLQAMTLPELDALWKDLLAHRTWPEGR